MSRRPSLSLLIGLGLAGWIGTALVHDVAAILTGPLLPHMRWLFP